MISIYLKHMIIESFLDSVLGNFISVFSPENGKLLLDPKKRYGFVTITTVFKKYQMHHTVFLAVCVSEFKIEGEYGYLFLIYNDPIDARNVAGTGGNSNLYYDGSCIIKMNDMPSIILYPQSYISDIGNEL